MKREGESREEKETDIATPECTIFKVLLQYVQ